MNFDKLIDRRICPTQQWNPTDLKQHFGRDDLLPFWIADMDLPGPSSMVDSLVVISNDAFCQQFNHFADHYQINRTNVFASAAMEAAYADGDMWLEALLDYLQQNVAFMQDYLQQHLPQVKLIQPEGTYLVWLDFRGLGLETKELDQFLAQKAGLALNSSYWFGREGAGFARMNIATPRELLARALAQLRQAIG